MQQQRNILHVVYLYCLAKYIEKICHKYTLRKSKTPVLFSKMVRQFCWIKIKVMTTTSKPIDAVGQWWRTSAAAATQHPSLEAARDFGEGWANLTPEPGGVDYIEVDAGGVPALWAIPKDCAADRVLLGFHGGGFFSGSMYTHRKLFAHFAKVIGCRALILQYRYAPENPYPAQLEDSLNAYQWLLNQEIAAHHIAFIGDSAGGNLCITTMLKARDNGLPLPAAAMPISPWYDMEGVMPSLDYNQGKDFLFTKEWVKDIAGMYLGPNGNPKDPYTNPLYADLKGLPPIYIQVGGDELLLDDSTVMAERAKQAGVEIRVDIFPGMQHTFQMAVGRAPESTDAVERYVAWVKPRLSLI
jgi:acetyl esterase/lipase